MNNDFFELDLDLPQKERWITVFKSYKQTFEKHLPKLLSLLTPFNTYIYAPKPIIYLYKYFGKFSYCDELEFIANELSIDFVSVLLLQFIYEFSSACTSIITEMNGTYVMFRTMDWPMDFLKELTVNLKFTKNKQTLFYATTR